MRNMKSIILLFFFWFVVLVAHAQPPVKLSYLTIEDGLSQGMVQNILQTQDGFIWLATKDGLNRYDGYDFKVYSHQPLDSFSISGHVINVLFEDNQGRLWVGTQNNGLNIFDSSKQRFGRLKYEGPNGKGLSSNRVFDIKQQNDSVFWVGTEGGLTRLTVPPADELWAAPAAANLSQRISSEKVTLSPDEELPVSTLLLLEGDTLIVGASHRVFQRAFSSNQSFEDITQRIGTKPAEGPFAFRSLISTEQGHLLLPAQDSIICYYKGESWPLRLPDEVKGYVPMLFKDNQGQVWGAASGLFRIYPERSAEQAIELIFSSLPRNTPCLYIDRGGVVWLGTNGYGIIKYNPAARRFGHLLPGKSARQVYVDLKGRHWAWLSPHLSIFDPQTGGISKLSGLREDLLRSRWVINDAEGSYWLHYPIVEKQAALVHFDERKGQSTAYPYNCDAYPDSPMMRDRHNNYWLGSGDGQLLVFNQEQKSFEYYSMTNWFSTPRREAFIVSFYYDERRDIVWAGTQYGLLRLKWTAQGGIRYKVFQNNPQASRSLSENHILSICADPQDDHRLWVGTKGGGLNHFDTRNGQCRTYRTEDGLPNDVIYGLLPDEQGRIWISTNRGLSCFTPSQAHFRNYSATDGLQSDEFNTTSYFRAADGKLIFGGVNGINSFYPADVDQESLPPKVKLTALSINNKAIDFKISPLLDRPLEHARRISLTHEQNLLHFRFAALDYAVPKNNRYRYQMQGLDPEPVEAGNRREVTYANLAPGQYTFRVWGANSDGVWSTAPAELEINIAPPWWASIWAYLAYFLLGGSLLYLLYRFQVKRAKLHNQLAYEQRESERLAELDRIKSDFFSNITHEFRTPLTLILEPARRLLPLQKGDEPRSWAKLIINNGERMLQLVNQLLDVNRLEERKLPVAYELGKLEVMLEELMPAFRLMAQEQGVQLGLDCEGLASDQALAFDHDKLRKIISNLLANAIKFTPIGGQVSIWAGSAEHDPEWIKLAVTDTGIGIPPEQTQRIFDRFYQVKDGRSKASGGTGIGLSLCKELTELMGGQISVASELDKGSCFTVLLPAHAHLAVPAPPLQPMPQEAPGPAEGQGLRLLIVEDHVELRAFIQSILAPHYELLTAEDGLQGLQIATAEVPDLILSDIMMPNLDGLSLTEQLKAHPLTSHIPIVLLTAKSGLQDRIKGLTFGADAYLGKPFHAEELLAQIQNLIEQRQRLQAAFQAGANAPRATAQKENPLPPSELAFLQQVEAVIEERLDDEALSVEQLSQNLYLSRSQLHRKLKALTGQSATAFIREYRLSRAFEMLQSKRGNVTEISLSIGFSSPQYFATRFKEKYGFPPSQVALD